MNKHDMDPFGMPMTPELLFPYVRNRSPGRGAHRALEQKSAWGGRLYVDLFGLRFNETTGRCHPSRLVGK